MSPPLGVACTIGAAVSSCIFCCEHDSNDDSGDDLSDADDWSPRPLLRRQEKLQQRHHSPWPLQRPIRQPVLMITGVGPVLGELMIHLADLYDFHEEVGNGSWGTVRRCVSKFTGKEFACKSTVKDACVPFGSIRNEVQVMQLLSGLPGIVRLERAYEDGGCVHLVMELCSGGEVFERMVREEGGRFGEGRAAAVFREVVEAVHCCHMMGVVHRDVKPENVMFASCHADSPVKLVDFGVSGFFQEGEACHGRKGTLEYCAPEILQQLPYGKEVDVWSAGVFLYMMLSGTLPFPLSSASPPTPTDVAVRLVTGPLDIETEPWPSVSAHAKDLVRRMLVVDPDHRITTAEILDHPWVNVEGRAALQVPSVFAFLIRFKDIREMNKIKRIALSKIVEKLSDDEVKRYKQTLQEALGDEHTGITFDDLMTKLSVIGSELSESELIELIDLNETSSSDRLEYLEFIAALMPSHERESQRNMLEAFQYFDADGDGFITEEDLNAALEPYNFKHIRSTVKKAIREADTNMDKRISFDEFIAMMCDQNQYLPYLREEQASEILPELQDQRSES